MAKTRTSNVSNLKSKRSKQMEHLHIALSKLNYYIIAAGIAIIIIGYICMSENSVDGFLPTVVAPVLLFIGYCIVIPIGILYKGKPDEVSIETSERVSDVKEDTGKSNVKSSSGNIKTS